MKHFRWPAWGMVLMLVLLPSLSACGEESVGINIVGYNHTDKDIGHFTVETGSSSGGGGFLMAHRGGGKFSCCISVPKPWKRGMKVTVGWTDDHDENYQERVVEVPKYEELGDMSVHFLRNGQIKVFVTMYALWHPDYPLKGKDAELTPGEPPRGPWDK